MANDECRCGGQSKEEVAMNLLIQFLQQNGEKRNEVYGDIDTYLTYYAKTLDVVQNPWKSIEDQEGSAD